jgi:small subunit ribosomal protein S1
VITNIDKDNRRISLGIKQLEEDPWMLIGSRFKLGQRVTVAVNRPLDRGLLVDMDFGFEGFVPVGELVGVEEAKLAETFKGGEQLDLLIIEIDQVNRRIALSQKAYQKSQENEDVKPFLKESADTGGTAMGDALKEALQKQEDSKPEAQA